MPDLPKSTKSPLTIIAIFAAIVEASALASLPFLKEQSQDIYTWFLVGFPPFLTLLFFITLNFNYKVFYSPSDFSNETDFLTIYDKALNADAPKTVTAAPLPAAPENTASDPPPIMPSNQPPTALWLAPEPGGSQQQAPYLSFLSGEVYLLDCNQFTSEEHFISTLHYIIAQPATDPSPPSKELIILITDAHAEQKIRNMLRQYLTPPQQLNRHFSIAAYNLNSLSLVFLAGQPPAP